MKKEALGVYQIIAANLLSAFIAILIRFGKDLGVPTMAFFRVFLAAIFLLPLFHISKKIKLAPFKKEKAKLIFFGLMHGIILLSYFISLNFLTIASASLLISSLSIWVVVFSYFILKEKIQKITLVSLIISIVGLILVLSPQNFFIFESLIGSALGLLGGILAGLVYVLSKTFKSYDKISLAFWQNLIASPFLIPLLFFGKPIFTFNGIIILILLGFIGALSFIFMYKGFGNVSGQKGGVLTLLYIVFVIILALIFFKEVPTLNEIFGGALIILGSYLSAKS